MNPDETPPESQEPKRCSSCNRILMLGDKPDRCILCRADDWAAQNHFGRYLRRDIGLNRAQRRIQHKHERTSAL